MSSGTNPSPARKTIGVFASHVGRAWGAEFLAGVTAAAVENNVNLVHFIGGKIAPLASNDPNKASFGLYDLAKPDQFDGLILAGDVAYGAGEDDLKIFRQTFETMPIVTQSIKLDGASMFVPNNVEGMRAVVRHLIEEHGYKRIAFLRGIPGQFDAEQRFQAYKDELKAHDLRLDENLVVDGDFTPESGRDAIHTLLDERRLRFQAVV